MQQSNRFWYGIGIGILGIILFSSKAVMVKLAYVYGIDPIEILLLRMVFSFPFYIVLAVISARRTERTMLNKKDWLWLAFFGFLGYYLASYFDFLGLVHIKASLERIILFVYPTIVLLLNRFFLRQPISKVQMAAIGITYLGIVLAFGDEVQISGDNTLLGGAFILLSALTYASYLVGSGWLIPKFGVMQFTSYAMIVSCLCVFLHYGISQGFSLFHYPWKVYGLGFLIAIFATVIPSYLVSASIKMISSSNFAIIAGIGPISTIVLAAIFLNEQFSLLQMFGALIVIIGILLISLKTSSRA
ncbi:DMT family transporter [Hyunsoonleella rubra]|uniref:DMT family transporter n=1 Tax=Hyunsoonleella rubra TaxID=1737062 RepID=A0ABW5TAL6_9FLAO